MKKRVSVERVREVVKGFKSQVGDEETGLQYRLFSHKLGRQGGKARVKLSHRDLFHLCILNTMLLGHVSTITRLKFNFSSATYCLCN